MSLFSYIWVFCVFYNKCFVFFVYLNIRCIRHVGPICYLFIMCASDMHLPTTYKRQLVQYLLTWI